MSVAIRDLPAHERPRERLAERGAGQLRESELVAILLRTGTARASAVDVGAQLLARFGGSLARVAAAPLDQLQEVPGIGRDKAVTLKAAFELARRLVREEQREQPLLDTPEQIARYVREEVRDLEVETFYVLHLNVRRRLVLMERLSQGTLDAVFAHPREVFRRAITAGAHAIALAHNHPSGDPSPSDPDVRLTRDLIRAGHLLRIEVVDHVIVGRPIEGQAQDWVSLRELGHFH
ncbi:MAG: DNA repair protein RadC [Limisphaerales bacterium]